MWGVVEFACGKLPVKIDRRSILYGGNAPKKLSYSETHPEPADDRACRAPLHPTRGGDLPAVWGGPRNARLLRALRGGHYPPSRLPAALAAPRLPAGPRAGPLPGLRRTAARSALLPNVRGGHHPRAPVQRRAANGGSPRGPGPRLPGAPAGTLPGLRRADARSAFLREVWDEHHACPCLPARRRAARLPAPPCDASPLRPLRRGDARAAFLPGVWS